MPAQNFDINMYYQLTDACLDGDTKKLAELIEQVRPDFRYIVKPFYPNVKVIQLSGHSHLSVGGDEQIGEKTQMWEIIDTNSGANFPYFFNRQDARQIALMLENSVNAITSLDKKCRELMESNSIDSFKPDASDAAEPEKTWVIYLLQPGSTDTTSSSAITVSLHDVHSTTIHPLYEMGRLVLAEIELSEPHAVQWLFEFQGDNTDVRALYGQIQRYLNELDESVNGKFLAQVLTDRLRGKHFPIQQAKVTLVPTSDERHTPRPEKDWEVTVHTSGQEGGVTHQSWNIGIIEAAILAEGSFVSLTLSNRKDKGMIFVFTGTDKEVRDLFNEIVIAAKAWHNSPAMQANGVNLGVELFKQISTGSTATQRYQSKYFVIVTKDNGEVKRVGMRNLGSITGTERQTGVVDLVIVNRREEVFYSMPEGTESIVAQHALDKLTKTACEFPFNSTPRFVEDALVDKILNTDFLDPMTLLKEIEGTNEQAELPQRLVAISYGDQVNVQTCDYWVEISGISPNGGDHKGEFNFAGIDRVELHEGYKINLLKIIKIKTKEVVYAYNAISEEGQIYARNIFDKVKARLAETYAIAAVKDMAELANELVKELHGMYEGTNGNISVNTSSIPRSAPVQRNNHGIADAIPSPVELTQPDIDDAIPSSSTEVIDRPFVVNFGDSKENITTAIMFDTVEDTINKMPLDTEFQNAVWYHFIIQYRGRTILDMRLNGGRFKLYWKKLADKYNDLLTAGRKSLETMKNAGITENELALESGKMHEAVDLHIVDWINTAPSLTRDWLESEGAVRVGGSEYLFRNFSEILHLFTAYTSEDLEIPAFQQHTFDLKGDQQIGITILDYLAIRFDGDITQLREALVPLAEKYVALAKEVGDEVALATLAIWLRVKNNEGDNPMEGKAFFSAEELKAFVQDRELDTE